MVLQELVERISQAVDQVRQTNPMAPSITNTVTIEFVANAQLAVGGSAAMVYLPDEGADVAKMAQATYLNFGTLLPVYAETIPRTARTAFTLGKKWVLDPVGIGIGTLREQLLLSVEPYKPAIIRCNASEAIALADLWGMDTSGATAGVRGVDSTDTVEAARPAAIALARHTGGAVAVSGEVDLVTDGAVVALSHGGSPLFSCITGSGCALGGVAAVYACVTDPFTAALTAVSAFNLAGTRAAKVASAPASFENAFIDELYLATAFDISRNPFEIEEA